MAVEDLLGSLELLLAVALHTGFVHVNDDKGVRKNAGFLHGQGLGASFGKSG
jgi:hypothetical protein